MWAELKVSHDVEDDNDAVPDMIILRQGHSLLRGVV